MTETKELVIHEKTGEPLVTEEIVTDYLKNLGVQIRDHHMRQFLHMCLMENLNPLKRDVYAIPYGNNFNIIVGYEVYLRRAQRSPLFQGFESGVDGEGEHLHGWAKIHIKGWVVPLHHKVYFNEYKQNNKMWREKPRTMIEKVALAQAFRRAFPADLGGLPYIEEESGSHGEEMVREEGEVLPPGVAKLIGVGEQQEAPPIDDAVQEVRTAHPLDPVNGLLKDDQPVEEALAQGMEEAEEVDEKLLKREMGKINRLKSSTAVEKWWLDKKDSIKESTNMATAKAVYEYVNVSIGNWKDHEKEGNDA